MILPFFSGATWKRLFCLLGLALLFIVLRWNNFDTPLIRDEGEYAYSAQLLKHGQLPYEHAFLQKPPMVAYSYALAQTFAPNTFWAPRILAYLFVALATALLGYALRLDFGSRVAMTAMWLFTPMVLLPGIQQFTANTEMFMVLPLMATVAISVASQRRGGGNWTWFFGGALGAITFWYKYTALPLLLVIAGGWLFAEWRDGRRGWGLARRALFGLMGAGVVSVAALGPFLASDGGRHLWECTVEFNRAYTSSSTFGIEPLWRFLKLLWTNWWILFLLPFALAFPRGRQTNEADPAGNTNPSIHQSINPPLLLWLALFAGGWLATGGSIYGHYYILVTPFWAAVAALAIDQLAVRTGRFFKNPSRLEPWLSRGLTAAVVALVCLSHLPWMRLTRQEFAKKRLGTITPFLESALVAKRVVELTGPNDYVYVAGSEPQILYYAKRFSPTRFIIAYPMMLPSPLAWRYQEEARRQIEERLPKVLVLARGSDSWLRQEGSPLEFMTYVQRLFTEEYDRVGGFTFDGQTGHWQEPESEAEAAKSSLVVYRRK